MIIKEGLRELPPDGRDFTLGGVFGDGSLVDVPDGDFFVGVPLGIKDQKDSDYCTAFAACAVSEDQEKVKLSPYYNFAKTKQIMGDKDSWGADLRSACKSFVKYGSVKDDEDPWYVKKNPFDRELVADWTKWPPIYDELAAKHKKKSYFKVQGPTGNMFNDIRIALWKHRKDRASVLVGLKWRHHWSNLAGGIIDEVGEGSYTPHAFKIFGQKEINGKIYLIAQLSNGTENGDKGFFYLAEEVVSETAPYGAFMFKDIDPIMARNIFLSSDTLDCLPVSRFLLWVHSIFS